MSAKTRACLKSRLLKSQPKEFLGLRGVKGCKRIHLSIDLGQNWGQSPESSLGNGHKSYWMEARLWARALPGKRWCARASWCLMLEVGYESTKWRRSSRRKGVPLRLTHSPALTSVPKLLAELHWSQQEARGPWASVVGGTSGNGLVWKGVQCCNFEYWGYWSYKNVAFFFRSKILYLFWNVC